MNELKKLRKRISELEKSENKLKQIEADLRLKNIVFDSSINANSIANSDGIITHVNSSFLKMWGYDNKNEVIGKTISNFFENEEELSLILEALNITRVWEGEFLAKRKSGSNFISRGLATAVVNENEEVIGYQSANLDITESKKVYKKLQEAYDIINKSSAITFLWKNEEGWPVEYVSENVVKLFEYTAEEFLCGKIKYIETIYPEDINRVVTEVAKNSHEKGRNRFSHKPYRIITKSGKVRWVDDKTFIRRKNKNVITHYQGIVEDITLRKLSELALLESEEKLRNIVEHSTNLFYSHTPEHKLTYVSPQTREFFDCEPEEALVKWTEFVTENKINETGFKLTERAIKTGKRQQPYRLELAGKLGRKIWVEVHEAPIVKNKKTVAIVGALLDITDRRKAEKALFESEKRYKIISQLTSDYSYAFNVDEDGNLEIEWVTEALVKITGFSKDELIKRGGWESLLYKDDLKIAYEQYENLLNFNDSVVEYRIVDKNKQIKWMRDYARPEIDSTTGKLKKIYGAVKDITEEKTSREIIHESQRKLNIIINNLPGMAYRCLNDEHYTMKFLSRRCKDITGYDISEIIDNSKISFNDIIHPEDRVFVAGEVKRQVSKKEEYELTYRIVNKSGEIRWVWERGQEVIDEVANERFLEGIIEDITEKREAEEKIKESEERYRAVVEQSKDCIFLADLETKLVLEANPSMQRLLGYTTEEIKNLSLYDFITHDKKSIERNINQIISDGYLFIGERVYTRKDGSQIDVEVSVSLISYGDKKVMSIVSRDITERSLAEKAIRESEEKFRSLAEYSPNMIFINKQGKVVYANRLAEKMSGYLREEIYSDDFDFTKLIVPEYLELISSNFKKHMEGKEVPPTEYQIKTKSGEVIDSVINTKLINYEGEKAILGILTDITELKNAERKLMDSRNQLRGLAERLQMIREEERATVAREIHDDLGQSLTALKMDISWLQKKPMNDIDRNTKLGAMIQLTDSIIQTVKRIASELRPGILDDLGLVSAIEWQKEEFEKRYNIKCNLKINKTNVITSDEFSIAVFRIFQETLTNIARHSKATKVDIKFDFKMDKKLLIEIQDNGVGIDNKTINSPNSLGLIGMRERVNILKGKMEIAGYPSKGTTVKISIPI